MHPHVSFGCIVTTQEPVRELAATSRVIAPRRPQGRNRQHGYNPTELLCELKKELGMDAGSKSSFQKAEA
ncbi:hypothetical protein D9619_003881 [Psilocybe cf. subviscida]|uniref:Uncharacterized protein n=1 Tax=Psilocybe cf. subviscida TaxID=2480587 RepID=A0A8H5BPQ8_9AGAR|nr:hypothetical protein D9619_003881 [Psilocybe cf. subviscida]